MTTAHSADLFLIDGNGVRVRAGMIAKVLLLLSFACVSVGCSLPKTFYSLDRVYTQEGKPQALIHKGRTWFSFLALKVDSRNYIADLKLDPGASGAAQLSNTRHLGDDGSGEKSDFTLMRGTSKVIQLQDHRDNLISPWDTTVDVLDLKTRRRSRITSVNMVAGYRDAIAVTRNGSRLLVVDAKKAVIYDAAQGKAIGRESDLLVELRRQIIEKCGIAGDWFLTDDLKYVVISPPEDIHEDGGMHSYFAPTLITIAGTTADLSESGLIFERSTGKMSVFPRRLESYYTVTDVEDVKGKLQFLYAGSGRACLTDATGSLLAEHRIPVPSIVDGDSAFAGWDPYREELWFRTVRGKYILNYRFPQTEAEHSIICWNIATKEEKRYSITGAQIAEAIAKVPWWQW